MTVRETAVGNGKANVRPRHQAIKRLLSKRLFTPSNNRFAFVYHDVSDVDSRQHASEYSTTVTAFRAQMEFLAKSFEFVELDDVLRPDHRAADSRRLATITFDDGFLSVREEAFPYLSGKGIPFSIFLNRTAIEENRLFYGPSYPHLNRHYRQKVFLDRKDVKYLSSSGVLVGSHTSTHRSLAGVGDEVLREEIAENKSYLESLIGKPVTHLALPFGKRQHYDHRVVDYCCAAGHEYVYSTNPVFFDAGTLTARCNLVPRVEVAHQPTEMIFFMLNRPLLKSIDL